MIFKGKILLADDEETFVESTAELLRLEGYECKTMRDAFAAAAEINTSSYDLLIADICMPGNANLELVNLLRDIATGLPVILVTGYPNMKSALGSADLTVLSYLVKPVKMDDLLPLVRRAVAQSAVLRSRAAIDRRLSDWLAESRSLEPILARGPTAPTVAPEAFANLALRHMLGCVAELQQMWERVSANQPHSRAPEQVQNALAAALKAFEASTQASLSATA